MFKVDRSWYAKDVIGRVTGHLCRAQENVRTFLRERCVEEKSTYIIINAARSLKLRIVFLFVFPAQTSIGIMRNSFSN